MIEKLTEYLINRRMRQRHIKTVIGDSSPEMEFRRVLNTLRENKVMVATKNDGIYIRLAGNVNKDEAFSSEFVRVLEFK